MNEMGGQNGLDAELARRLERERPIPASDFREDLRRQLSSAADVSAPSGLGSPVVASAVAGSVLLLVVVLGIAGLGPLAPG